MKKRARSVGVVDVTATLASARAATDVAAQLRALVDVWRAVPDPVLADAIVRLGAVAQRGTPLPIAGGDAERQENWLALAADDDPIMRGRLIESMLEGKRKQRLEAIQAWPDPRTTDRILEALLEERRSRVYFARDHRPLFEALPRCRDPRVVAHVPKIRELWEETLPYWTVEGRKQRAVVAAALEEALGAHPKPHPRLGADARELVEAIVAALGARPADDDAGAALRAAVYARPHEDGPRQVYADFLLERGDPRGEHLVLQLAKTTPRFDPRVLALEEGRERDWLDPAIAPWVREDRAISYRRGFPAELGVKGEAPAHPAWSTVEEIDGFVPATDEHPMPLLRVATSIDARGVARLAGLAEKPPLERLEVSANLDELAPLRLPRLRELELTRPVAPSGAPWLLAIGPLAKLTVRSELDDFAAWHAAVARSELAELVLVLDRSNGHVRCVRDRAGRLSQVELARTNVRVPAQMEAIARQLAALPPDTLTTLAIDRTTRAWSAASVRALSEALARHPSVESDLTTFLRARASR